MLERLVRALGALLLQHAPAHFQRDALEWNIACRQDFFEQHQRQAVWESHDVADFAGLEAADDPFERVAHLAAHPRLHGSADGGAIVLAVLDGQIRKRCTREKLCLDVAQAAKLFVERCARRVRRQAAQDDSGLDPFGPIQLFGAIVVVGGNLFVVDLDPACA